MWIKRITLDEQQDAIGGMTAMPRTLLELDARESQVYDEFCSIHSGIKGKLKDMGPEHRTPIEENLRSQFRGIVQPYLEECHLRVGACHVYYADNVPVLVETPRYVLYEDKNPDISISIHLWFSRHEEGLNCAPTIQIHSATDDVGIVAQQLFNAYTETVEQDGINFPYVQKRAPFIAFSPTTLAVPLMLAYKSVIDGVGNDTFQTFVTICKARRANRDSAVDQILKESYDDKMRTALEAAGLIR